MEFQAATFFYYVPDFNHDKECKEDYSCKCPIVGIRRSARELHYVDVYNDRSGASDAHHHSYLPFSDGMRVKNDIADDYENTNNDKKIQDEFEPSKKELDFLCYCGPISLCSFGCDLVSPVKATLKLPSSCPICTKPGRWLNQCAWKKQDPIVVTQAGKCYVVDGQCVIPLCVLIVIRVVVTGFLTARIGTNYSRKTGGDVLLHLCWFDTSPDD
ncbi:hypothetical protein ACFX13_039483 [Malus domestica]|uniref:Uncharacterized protein n=1 Tax=Malus domestica TaxID=3750 RepID=A0A498JKF9_MALDO|nr:hypothetical protein DVH24_008560 [Malus domestica]